MKVVWIISGILTLIGLGFNTFGDFVLDTNWLTFLVLLSLHWFCWEKVK